MEKEKKGIEADEIAKEKGKADLIDDTLDELNKIRADLDVALDNAVSAIEEAEDAQEKAAEAKREIKLALRRINDLIAELRGE